jgi:hypothetical protein
MKKLERYNLVGKIALELQATMNSSGINIFLGGFGVEHEMVDIVPSKRIYVEKLLASEQDDIIIEIASELNIEVPNSATATCKELINFLTKGGYKAAEEDFERSLGYVNSDPEQALGSASSTLESICKTILDEFNEEYPKDESLQPLLKAVFSAMDLSPEGHADPDIKRVLGGLLNAAIGIGVLRTKYSGFHGKGTDQKRKKLTGRHSRLAVNSCAAIGLFLIETHIERFQT